MLEKSSAKAEPGSSGRMAELILYWRGMAEVRHDLINCLSEKQFAIQQCRSLDEVLTITEETPPLAIIVDASAGEREASDRCIDLSTAAPLFKMQLMFISVQATRNARSFFKITIECFILSTCRIDWIRSWRALNRLRDGRFRPRKNRGRSAVA